MKRNQYASIFTSLALSEDQQNELLNFLESALDSLGQRDGVPVDYSEAVNAIYALLSGELESTDNFDDEFDLSSIDYDLDAIETVLDGFESDHSHYAVIFRARATIIRNAMRTIMTRVQYYIAMKAITSLFRSRLYFTMNYITDASDELKSRGVYFTLAKLSFARALGISLLDMKNDCLSGRGLL